jgi:hypothetical protein
MDIGFTGTRKGMSNAQKRTLEILLYAMSDDGEADNVLHHGGEAHSDTEAAEIATGRFTHTRRHHPASKASKDLLGRNRDIVDASAILIAAPDSLLERIRSGTWYTVRYARRAGVPVILLDP